jgi:hypothetical protein
MRLDIENMEAWTDKRLCSATLLRMTVATYAIKKFHAEHTGWFQKIAHCKDF